MTTSPPYVDGHGLLAGRFAITEHDRDAFEQFRADLLAELSPIGQVEALLADRVAVLSWRLLRSDRIQTGALGIMAETTTNFIKKRMKPSTLPGFGSPQDEEAYLLGETFVRDFANSKILDRLAAYERRIERSLHATRHELRRLQTQRADSGNPPAGAPTPMPQISHPDSKSKIQT
jgi:hypothetical protein